MFKSKEQKEREKENERLLKVKQEKIIEEFQEKCNFLSNEGKCILSYYVDWMDCNFNECIFMKILNK